jgi:hypothetical protein
MKARPRRRGLSLKGRQLLWIGGPALVAEVASTAIGALVTTGASGWGAGAGVGIGAALMVAAAGWAIGDWLDWSWSSLWDSEAPPR